MYYDHLVRVPVDENDLWGMLIEQFEEHIISLFLHSPVETREDALSNNYHQNIDGKIRRDGVHVIRYRNESNEIGQRDHFYNMGRELLPYIEQALIEKKLTPEFVQQWGKLMFCHGYIASYVFDDSDDLEINRNRIKGTRATDRTPQRIFLARLLLWFMDEQKQRRKQAQSSAAKAIWDFIETVEAEKIPDGYNLDWFKTLVRGHPRGRIVSTMEQNNMNEATLREFAAAEFDNLPSIELVVSSAHS